MEECGGETRGGGNHYLALRGPDHLSLTFQKYGTYPHQPPCLQEAAPWFPHWLPLWPLLELLRNLAWGMSLTTVLLWPRRHPKTASGFAADAKGGVLDPVADTGKSGPGAPLRGTVGPSPQGTIQYC